ncbi:hypothetical protein ACWD3Z_22760 [Streptomyces sp. NPDC002740]
MKKLVTVRGAVVMGVAVAAGSAAGGAVETWDQLAGAGPVVTGMVALWCAEKLDRLVGGEGGES